MLPRLHIFQLPRILKAWRADRKACICLWLSMCPRKSIFSTQAAGCTLQFHCAHWAVGRIKAFLSASTIYGKQDSSPSPPISNLLQAWSSPTAGKKKKKRKKPSTLLTSAAETLEALIVRRFSLKSNLTPLALHHYGTLQYCIYASLQHTGSRALSLLLQLCLVSSSA